MNKITRLSNQISDLKDYMEEDTIRKKNEAIITALLDNLLGTQEGNKKYKEQILSLLKNGYTPSEIYQVTLNSFDVRVRGVVYTPEVVTTFLCETAIERWFKDNGTKEENESLALLINNNCVEEIDKNTLISIYEKIKQLKILEPTAGCGDMYFSILKYIYELLTVLEVAIGIKGKSNILQHIVENVLYANELEKHSCSVLRGICINKYFYEPNITNEDYLKIDNSNKFDIIISNPPYVRGQNLDKTYKDWIVSNYITFTPSSDICLAMMEKMTRDCKASGNINCIVTNKWITAQYGVEFRRFVLNKMYALENFKNNKVFEANVETCMLHFKPYDIDDGGEVCYTDMSQYQYVKENKF